MYFGKNKHDEVDSVSQNFLLHCYLYCAQLKPSSSTCNIYRRSDLKLNFILLHIYFHFYFTFIIISTSHLLSFQILVSQSRLLNIFSMKIRFSVRNKCTNWTPHQSFHDIDKTSRPIDKTIADSLQYATN